MTDDEKLLEFAGVEFGPCPQKWLEFDDSYGDTQWVCSRCGFRSLEQYLGHDIPPPAHAAGFRDLVAMKCLRRLVTIYQAAHPTGSRGRAESEALQAAGAIDDFKQGILIFRKDPADAIFVAVLAYLKEQL